MILFIALISQDLLTKDSAASPNYLYIVSGVVSFVFVAVVLVIPFPFKNISSPGYRLVAHVGTYALAFGGIAIESPAVLGWSLFGATISVILLSTLMALIWYFCCKNRT